MNYNTTSQYTLLLCTYMYFKLCLLSLTVSFELVNMTNPSGTTKQDLDLLYLQQRLLMNPQPQHGTYGITYVVQYVVHILM